MDTPAPRHWHISEHADLVWRHWDGDYVFHHALSNDTHRLSEAAGRVLVQLASTGEQDEASLAENCDLDDIDVEVVLSALAQLDFVTCR